MMLFIFSLCPDPQLKQLLTAREPSVLCSKIERFMQSDDSHEDDTDSDIEDVSFFSVLLLL